MLVECLWDYIVVLQQFAGIEETFYGFVVKTGIDAYGSRGRVYGRCRVWRDVERVGGARNVVPARTREVRLEPVWNVRDRLTTRSSTGDTRRPWPCPSPSLHPVNFGSSRQSLRLRVRLPSRLLTWQTTDLPEGHYRGVFLFLLFVCFVISVVILICKIFHPQIFVVYFSKFVP